MKEKKELSVIPENQLMVSEEINKQVLAVLSEKSQNFEKSFTLANAITTIRNLLTPEIMTPIMCLAGSKLGFLTDKDKPQRGGVHQKYSVDIVRDCLIEATLIGLTPTGNQFNIIAGNMYITKEGFSFLLDNIKELDYTIVYQDVVFSSNKEIATVGVKITHSLNNKPKEINDLTFSVKAGAYATVDSCIGKAERKAKCWLYNHVKGTNFSDGDAQDIQYTEVSSTRISNREHTEQKERTRIMSYIDNTDKLMALLSVKEKVKNMDDIEIQEHYSSKESKLVTSILESINTLEELERLDKTLNDSFYSLMIDKKRLELTK